MTNFDPNLQTPTLARPLSPARVVLGRGRQSGMGCVTLVAIFFVAVLAFGAAYQARPGYKIDLGDKLDRPYLSSFEAREQTQQGVSFRWSHATSQIDLPGLGSQPLSLTVRYAPVANPKLDLSITVNDKNRAVLSPPINQDGWLVQSFQVPANWFPDGHLHLKVQSSTFRPPNDRRPNELGLAFDWLTVTPDNTASSGFIRPPDSVFLALVFAAVLLVLIFLSIGVPMGWALGGGAVAVGGFSYWLINDRLSLTTLLQQDFIRVLFLLWVGTYLVAEYGPRIYRRLGLPTGRVEGGWLAGLFLLHFVVLYFVQLHPLFRASDLSLHEHKVQQVAGGDLVFAEDLPGGLHAPYPPGFYVLLQLFTGLSGTNDAQLGSLITFVNTLLAATGVFLIYYLASLLRGPIVHQIEYVDNQVRIESRQQDAVGPDWAALIAAAFYTLDRFQYFVFSQGNQSNLFGAWLFLLFLCVIAGTLNYLRHPRPRRKLVTDTGPVATAVPALSGPRRWWRVAGRQWKRTVWPRLATGTRSFLPIALLWAVFLSHYGTFLFANGFMLAYIGVMVVLGGKAGRREAIYLGFCWLVALVLALALYYYNFVGILTTQLTGSKDASRGSLDWLASLKAFYTSSRDNFGLIVLIAALGGLALWLARRYRRPQWWQVEPVAGALVALVLTSLVFALAETIQRESRYQLYFVTALVILAGYWLGQLWRRGWPSQLLVVSLFLFQFLSVLLFWLDRVTYYL